LLYLIRQVGEIRREYGGRKLNQNGIQGLGSVCGKFSTAALRSWPLAFGF
jgi:hypothetical protein